MWATFYYTLFFYLLTTMQNLLQSLHGQRLRLNVQDNDLKRLLNAVKDGRVCSFVAHLLSVL